MVDKLRGGPIWIDEIVAVEQAGQGWHLVITVDAETPDGSVSFHEKIRGTHHGVGTIYLP
ncbi:MAG: hypothetical protein IPF53_22560 [Blastocatellia bacterium]|nr:hypothetical protein [Blastocatellia bacterium]